jgi:hypothetical protein
MTDLRDLSRLPEDSGYWDGLEARIMADVGPHVRARADRRPVLLAPLASRAWGLGGLAAAATLVAVLLAPPRSSDGGPASAGLLRLPTDDPTLRAFVSAPAPPPLVSLVVPRPPGSIDD